MNFVFNKEKSIEINMKFALKYIKMDVGFYVQKSAIKLLIKTLKVSNKQTKIDTFKKLEKELSNKGFYVRRVYFEFVSELINVFSIKFAENFGVLENLYSFFSDKLPLNVKSIKILQRIVPFASEKCINTITTKLSIVKSNSTTTEDFKNVNCFHYIIKIN